MANQLAFNYYFVNDGSKDRTLEVLRQVSKQFENVHYLSFSRNFGKEAGLLAGLEAAQGDYVTVMDADLQDPPELLIEMYAKIQEGYDVVGTRRADRKGEPPIRSLFAKAFYWLINKVSDTEMVDGARDFRLMTRQVVDAILELKEVNRFSKGLFSWVGFDVAYVSYENRERVAGETSWSFWSLLSYFEACHMGRDLLILDFFGWNYFRHHQKVDHWWKRSWLGEPCLYYPLYRRNPTLSLGYHRELYFKDFPRN